MADELETTTVPKNRLVQHIVAETLEAGEWDYIPSPPRDASDDEFEFSLKDVNDWDVDYHDDGRISLFGTTEASYSRKVSRRTRHQPAEYKTHTVPLGIEIVADLEAHSGLGEYTIRAEVM